jgi:predicted Zn-dependent protease
LPRAQRPNIFASPRQAIAPVACPVRRNVAEPPFSQDEGAMLTVRVGVEAYAATADMSQSGLQRALEQARRAGPAHQGPQPARLRERLQ